MSYIKIKSQNGDIHFCKHIVEITKDSKDYGRPFWLCTDDKNGYILGCYKTYKRTEEIRNEIFKTDGAYEMPQE